MTKLASQQSALKRRIRRLYERLNANDFAGCHQMIDPRVRDQPTSVTLLQYENAARDFLAKTGGVKVMKVEITLHIAEPSKLYEDRDFAVGQTCWQDEYGQEHMFNERWVREGRTWFTRCTGFLASRTAVQPVRS